MKRRKQETITTYISTLTVNFGNNESTKSKPHSKSLNSPSKQQNVHSSTAYRTETTEGSQSYRQAKQNSTGTYYQLPKSTSSNSSSKGPAQKNTAPKNSSSFQSSRAYFEDLSTSSGDGSRSKSCTSPDVQRPKNNFSKESKFENSSPPTAAKWKAYESEFKPEASTFDSSVKTLDSPKTRSSSSVTKKSTESRVSKELTTTTTTTTTTTVEKQGSSSVKAEVTSVKPATDYGETDWYLDILLRMQSLEMKQQKLHAQYDFLGKLAKENRENLKLSRDWARYNADNFKVEAY
ncbi:uncharacterized serine-rich protein C215.13-like isoform X2 [Actinia tenebrosa]|uniref:Uncharacterized serine-rich protein C215.13-like isoform X2 n=1 Tax=Actinia tenebrosa TaxID=6105 RepID=A0A6P8IIU5_ACTTE|nr:uncharacterized serine-rich protein C215.13-like isoform X2 [Actinia tenebrosa]